MTKTKALVRLTSFEPLLHLLLESVASGVLVQALAERWWDTTQTFHIAKKEMAITPNDFHRMTGLRSRGPIISLEGKSSATLGKNLLLCTYPSEHVYYFDLVADFRPLSQVATKDQAQMARAF